MKRQYIILLFTIATIVGCASPPILIQSKDQTYARAQRRLERTQVLVDGMKVSPAERTMFMQAENFYRYRFRPPPRSSVSSLMPKVLERRRM